MPNTSVQAAGEAMPGDSIFDLVAAFALAKAVAEEAERVENELYERGDRPAWPAVKPREFPLVYNVLDRGDYLTSSQIDAAVDRYKQSVHSQARLAAMVKPGEEAVFSPERKAKLQASLDRAEEVRAQMQALYDERKRVYEEWKAVSGWGKASDEAENRWNVAFDIQDRILAFNCTTLPEISAKAGYIVAEHGPEYAQERMYDFIVEVSAMAGQQEGAQ